MSLNCFTMPKCQGERNFFHVNTADQWSFENYVDQTHNDINKHKNHNAIRNDYLHDLNWIEQQDVPEEIKGCIEKLKENMPSKSELKAKLAKRKKKIINDNRIIIKNNTINIGTINLGDSSGEKGEYKEDTQKDNEDDEEYPERKKERIDQEKDSLWKDWIEFLNNEENIEKFHPYSPENHGVVRCGRGVSPKPNLDKDLYLRLLQSHCQTEYKIPSAIASYASKIIDTANTTEFKKAIQAAIISYEDDNKEKDNTYEATEDFARAIMKAWHIIYTTKQNIELRESVYNDFLVYPFLKVLAEINACDNAACDSEFVVGEVPLSSMKKQLNDEDGATSYLADGVIKLFSMKETEILLLETSSHFGCRDNVKISFDHHKGLFGTLSMLKTIADQYYYGTLKTFTKTKVFFLQAAGRFLYLWSMRYVEEGPAYELWLEDLLKIDVEFEEREEMLPRMLSFWWCLKSLVDEATKNVALLSDEHLEMLKRCRFSSPPSKNLADIVNPSILKLSETEDKKGMQKLGPFFHK